jgi:hypothetical protein
MMNLECESSGVTARGVSAAAGRMHDARRPVCRACRGQGAQHVVSQLCCNMLLQQQAAAWDSGSGGARSSGARMVAASTTRWSCGRRTTQLAGGRAPQGSWQSVVKSKS